MRLICRFFVFSAFFAVECVLHLELLKNSEACKADLRILRRLDRPELAFDYIFVAAPVALVIAVGAGWAVTVRGTAASLAVHLL